MENCFQHKIIRFFLIGFSFFLVIAFNTSCEKAETNKTATEKSIFNAFESEETIAISISTDVQKLLNDKEASYQKANLHLNDQSYEIELSPRGKTRKNICDFPPLKLKFSDETLEQMQLADYSSLKLVTHCQGDEDLVLKEYLTYKMFNLLTEKSFKVQLAKIKYIDENGTLDTIEKYGFLIENSKEMANRLKGQIIKDKTAKLKSIDAKQYRTLTLFQYMVGNTDWNLSKRHNIKMVQPTDHTAPIPVPYDFDYAGLVDAPYASPHPQLPINDVKDRFFQWRGKCANGFEETLDLFKTKKEDLLTYCANFDNLDESIREEMLDYINSFYEIIEHQDQLEDNLADVANSKSCTLS